MKGLLKHSKLIIALCVVLTVALAIPLKNIRIESSIRQFFPVKHESFQRLNRTEDEFGSMLAIGVSLETPGETILTTDYIEIIRKIVTELETVENISDVTSVVNVDYIEGVDGSINVAPLLDKSTSDPITEEDIFTIQSRLSAWEEMYNLVVINKERNGTQIAMSVNHKAPLDEQQAALAKVTEIVENHTKDTDLMVKFYGDPVISRESKSFLLSDLLVLIPLVVLVVAISLFFSFSTVSGTVLVLLSVLMSTIWSVGIMSLSGIEFSLVSSVIPVALIGCGSAYGIHVLTHYYVEIYRKKEELDKAGQPMTKEINETALKDGLANVKQAIMLAAVTTIAGFISLVTSPIRPLFGFAIFTALGIFFSLVLSVTFIPAVLVQKKVDAVGRKSHTVKILTKKIKKRAEQILHRHGTSKKHDASDTMYSMYSFFCGSKPRIVIFTLIITLASAFGIHKLIIDTSMINYFPKSAQVRKDVDYVNENFAGTNSIYLLIKSPAAGVKAEATALFDEAQALADAAGENIDEATQAKIDEILAKANEKAAEYANLPNMTDPEVLKTIDNMEKWIESKFDLVGKAVSYTDSIKRINQTWNAPGANSGTTAGDTTGMVDFESDLDGWDDWGDFGFGDTEETATVPEEPEMTFEDPNIAYQAMLEKQMTGSEIQALVDRAYSKAGGKNATIEAFVSAIQQEMNYNGAAFYEIPYEPSKYQKAKRSELAGLISNYTMMLGDSMERFTDDQTNYTPTTIRMQVQVKSNSTQDVGKIIKKFNEYAKVHLPEGYYMEATGQGEMEYVMTNLVVSSQLTSLLFSLILVFVIIGISFKSPVAGIIGCIPLAFCILLNYMVMGAIGIHLDLITSIIASVAVGVGIDYTIHFMTEFKACRLENDDLEYCTKETFRTSGAGIVTNAIAVGLGFLVLCFSKFVVLRYIGILIALVMFTSAVLAMTIIPGIFNAFDPKFLHPGKPKSTELEN